MKSVKLDPTIFVDGLRASTTSATLGAEPTVTEETYAVHTMANGKAVGPGQLRAWIIGLHENTTIICELHCIIVDIRRWRSSKKTHHQNISHTTKERTECSTDRGMSLVAHEDK